jgi:hypothetical protein
MKLTEQDTSKITIVPDQAFCYFQIIVLEHNQNAFYIEKP